MCSAAVEDLAREADISAEEDFVEEDDYAEEEAFAAENDFAVEEKDFAAEEEVRRFHLSPFLCHMLYGGLVRCHRYS